MLNFAWTMADFALLFPGSIMPLSTFVLLYLNTMATGQATFWDGVGSQHGGGNMV